MTELKQLVEFIAKALVDDPSKVEVNAVEGDHTSILELKVSNEDLGKVIGKEGRTAKAIRALLSAASTKKNKKAVLEIVE